VLNSTTAPEASSMPDYTPPQLQQILTERLADVILWLYKP
jgi:hypothetical protein